MSRAVASDEKETYHFNWIELAMKLGKEKAYVPCILYEGLEH